MSILIKGMEMPTACRHGECNFACSAAYQTGLICIVRKQYVVPGDVPGDCPCSLVPPHGRLIDADALSAKIIEIVEQQKYDDFYTQTLSVGAILREVVNDLKGTTLDGYANAPTIIPADKDGE